MSNRVFYVFGCLNDDGSPSIYDSLASHERIRFSLCDTPDDLPTSGIGEWDIAIVKDTRKLMFVDDGQWVEVKGKKD